MGLAGTAATWLRLGIAPATVPACPSYARDLRPEWHRRVKFRPPAAIIPIG